MRILLAVLCFLTLIRMPLFAEITVKVYHERMRSSNESEVAGMKIYVKGLGEGLGWANTELGDKNLLYCPPPKLGLGTENFLDMIDKKIESLSSIVPSAKLDEMWIGLLLVKALKETFPCGGSK
jgi:hypothetical protein